MAKLLTQTFFQFDQEAPMARTSPSSVTCYSCDLSHLEFPISLPPTTLGSTRVGPLTSSTVASSITLLPENTDGQVNILSVTSLPSPDTPMLKVQYKNEGEAPARALLAYLSEGITWEPSYVVVLEPKSRMLRLAGRATIISSIPFLDDVTVPALTLVSGSPTIVCQGQVDSLVNGEEARRGRRRRRSSPAYSATSPDRSRSRSRSRSKEAGKMESNLQGHRLAEFYHFVIKDVPFHHQRPTSVPFMEEVTSISYNEVFKIILGRSSSDQRLVAAEHLLLLPTSCLPPIPKGPVMVLAEQEGRGRQLLAQTFLQSSPEFFSLQLTKQSSEVGAICSLVTMREEEKKVEVKKRRSRWEENEQEYRSVLITSMKEGKIKVTNRKEEAAKVEVEYTMLGNLISAKPKCSKTVEMFQMFRIGANTQRRLTWDLEVPAKGNIEIIFEMEEKEWRKENEGCY